MLESELDSSASPNPSEGQTSQSDNQSADNSSSNNSEDIDGSEGTEIASMMGRLGGPKPIPQAVQKKLDGVSAAVIKAGGLMANRPQASRKDRLSS